MKNHFIPLIVIGILVSASFGLVMMSHMDEQGHSQCPFETAGVTVCGLMQTPIDFVVSHLNALSNFFSGTLATGAAVMLAMMMLFVFSFFAELFGGPTFKPRPLLISNVSRELFVSPHRQRLVNWFSLHENSPTASYRR